MVSCVCCAVFSIISDYAYRLLHIVVCGIACGVLVVLAWGEEVCLLPLVGPWGAKSRINNMVAPKPRGIVGPGVRGCALGRPQLPPTKP